MKRHHHMLWLALAAGLILAPAAAARDAGDFPESGSFAELPVMTIQCVPYARETSGISIYGDAATWWGQAEGRYARGAKPRVGAVLALSASSVMPSGHVATISRIVGPRDILLDHANWSEPNMIEHDVLARDVSPNNDWSEVRVWYAPTNSLGARVNPVDGFIYPDRDAAPTARYAAATSFNATFVDSKPAPKKAKKSRDPFIIEYADAPPINLIPAAFYKRR